MKRLGTGNARLLINAIKVVGTYDPVEVLGYCGEQMYVDEYAEVEEFLQWVHTNDRPFGTGNYEEVFSDWKMQKQEVI